LGRNYTLLRPASAPTGSGTLNGSMSRGARRLGAGSRYQDGQVVLGAAVLGGAGMDSSQTGYR
jgi:hypothetical protein